mmetsp:Transcript_13579/g.30422  ORF Transcript_13579/g.30422 Transcript_13579/m.30422 type:complete len:245 (+) Transcript_13579:333-1067(+)
MRVSDMHRLRERAASGHVQAGQQEPRVLRFQHLQHPGPLRRRVRGPGLQPDAVAVPRVRRGRLPHHQDQVRGDQQLRDRGQRAHGSAHLGGALHPVLGGAVLPRHLRELPQNSEGQGLACLPRTAGRAGSESYRRHGSWGEGRIGSAGAEGGGPALLRQRRVLPQHAAQHRPEDRRGADGCFDRHHACARDGGQRGEAAFGDVWAAVRALEPGGSRRRALPGVPRSQLDISGQAPGPPGAGDPL